MRTLAKLAAFCILMVATFAFSQETSPEVPRIIPARINLNSASKEQLVTLDGIDVPIAEKIIAGRPYKSSDELIERKILTEQAFDKISHRIGIGPSKEIRILPSTRVYKIADDLRQ